MNQLIAQVASEVLGTGFESRAPRHDSESSQQGIPMSNRNAGHGPETLLGKGHFTKDGQTLKWTIPRQSSFTSALGGNLTNEQSRRSMISTQKFTSKQFLPFQNYLELFQKSNNFLSQSGEKTMNTLVSNFNPSFNPDRNRCPHRPHKGNLDGR